MKAALFYTAWTDSIGKIVAGGVKAGVAIDPFHYSQIVWRWNRDQWQATVPTGDLADYGIFYCRSVGDKNEILPLLLEYGRRREIRVADDYLRRLGGAIRKRKSMEAAVLLTAGISYPESIFAPGRTEMARIVGGMPKPVVVKKTGGRHGLGTFLVKENKDLEKVFLGRRRADFLIQKYIPNDGDYRLFLIGYQVVAGFKRQIKEEKLILNQSQGSSVALAKIPEPIRREAEKAARVLGVEIAGVDLVVNKHTGQPVVIEVNQAPEFRIMEKRSGLDIGQLIAEYLIKIGK